MSIIYILTYDIMIVRTTHKNILPEYDVVSTRADLGIVRYVKYDFVSIWIPDHLDRNWQIGTYVSEHGTDMYVHVHEFTYSCEHVCTWYIHVHEYTYMYIHVHEFL